MQFSKTMLILHILVTVGLCVTTIVGSFRGVDVTAVGALAAASFLTDGTWGGFYLWKSKNENRAKYAQKFIRILAERHGIDAAIQIAQVVLKD